MSQYKIVEVKNYYGTYYEVYKKELDILNEARKED